MNSIPVILVVLFTGFSVFAQNSENEILNREELDVTQDIVEQEERNAFEPNQESPPHGLEPSEFRRRSRFGGKSDRKSRNSGNFKTGENNNEDSATTPVDELEVQNSNKKKKKKKKITFAEAHPEDITDENFPDLITSFDYPNASIMDVIKAIGKLTKKNFIIDKEVASGKITIVAPTPVTVAQAWKLFLTALAMNGFTVVPTNDGYMKIRKSDKAMNDSIETYSGDYYPTSDQLITRIIRLKYIQASSIGKSLEKFTKGKAQVGKIEAYDDTNSVIISGYGSSVQRISTIVEQLDKPGFEERLEVIPIRHAKAKSIAELIEKIIKGGEDNKKTSRFRSSRLKRSKGKAENLKLVKPDERTNSIIVVGNSQGILKIKKLVKQLDYPLDPADAGGVYVYYVKHGNAKAIADTLSGIAKDSTTTPKKENKKGKIFEAPKAKKPIFGGDVAVKADENTNSLIITANKQDYQVVKSLLAKIDIPKDQVFVEAIIMEMETTNSNIWNMNYMQFFKKEQQDQTQNTNNEGGTARVGFTGGKIIDLINPVGGKGAILNLGDPKETIRINGPGGQQIEIPTLLALINFLKEKTNANILSTPNILAMDNEESTIEVGEEVPVGGTQNFSNQGVSSITPQFKPATIFLQIKPQISPESNIVNLSVEQRIQKVSTKPIQAEQLAQSTQSLTKKELKTSIVLESGQTAVLGGLMEDEDIIQETKIPLLGDIPVLGWLFKNRTVRKIKKNLVVFLTPEIIRNSAGHRRLLNTKINERINWIKKYNGGRDPYGERFNSLIENAVSTTSPGAKEFDLEEVVPSEDESEKLGPTPIGDESVISPDNQESDGTLNLNPIENQLEINDEPVEFFDSTSSSSEDSSMFWNTAPSEKSSETPSGKPQVPQSWESPTSKDDF